MVHSLFQLGAVSGVLFLAGVAVVPHSPHHPAIFCPGPPHVLAGAALSGVGGLCRVSQLGDFLAQPMKKALDPSKVPELFSVSKKFDILLENTSIFSRSCSPLHTALGQRAT